MRAEVVLPRGEIANARILLVPFPVITIRVVSACPVTVQ